MSNGLGGEVALLNVPEKAVTVGISGDEAEYAELFPVPYEEYTKIISKLHMCFCGKNAADGFALSRCASCKATYYCSAEHQRHAWATAPFLHKNFCQELQQILQAGFGAVSAYMKVFSPQNAPNIKLNTAVEGWTIASAALEKKLFTNTFEEAKLLFWAGTCHAMVCGQLMRQRLASFDLQQLLQFFAPSINFFENVLHVAPGSERGLEVIPFARFELFGLWSSLALSLKDTDPERMNRMFYAAAVRYGNPAITSMLELLSSGNDNIDADALGQNLQQWTQSVLTILTQRKSSFPLGEQTVAILTQFADDDGGQGSRELALFAKCLYESAVEAHEEVEHETGLQDTQWKLVELELYSSKRQRILQDLLQAAFPGLQMGPEEGQ